MVVDGAAGDSKGEHEFRDVVGGREVHIFELSRCGERRDFGQLSAQNRPAVFEIAMDIGFDLEGKRAFALEYLEGRFRDEVAFEIPVLLTSVNPHVAGPQPVSKLR